VVVGLEVDRQDLHRTRYVPEVPSPLLPGQARLHIDRFGLTANNITYAVFGDAMHYWEFFPGPKEDGVQWGRVPVWGFADVAESAVPGLSEGTRVYGYFPMAEELVVEPDRLDESGFSDAVPHRRTLTSVYNRYARVDADPAYHSDREPQQMLLWPLFVTSFLVDDFLGDHDLFGASRVVLSSASAKTSVAAAFLLAERPDVEVVGLTSTANRSFVEALGCYHRTLTYDELGPLPAGEACYIDVAGRRDVTAAVHAHLGVDLRYSMVVGDTHWDHHAETHDPLVGPSPVFLFAPDQIAKRRREWGRSGFEQAVAAAWERFSPWTDAWLTVADTIGPAGVEGIYRDLLDGRVDPHRGDVCTLRTETTPGEHRSIPAERGQ
jgi:Protein of unknown function (DUF2855)